MLAEKNMMKKQYEYKFIRIGEGCLGVKSNADAEYQQVIQEHALDGWRLVQVFAPSIGSYGCSKYFEVILEREAGN